MPVILRYTIIALWLLMGWWIAKGALVGRPVRGGMVQTRPPLRSSWPLLTVIWIAIGFVLFAVVAPY